MMFLCFLLFLQNTLLLSIYASDVINVVFRSWPWTPSCLLFVVFQSDETDAMWATAGIERHFIKLYLPVTGQQLTPSSDAAQNLKMEIYLIKKWPWLNLQKAALQMSLIVLVCQLCIFIFRIYIIRKSFDKRYWGKVCQCSDYGSHYLLWNKTLASVTQSCDISL